MREIEKETPKKRKRPEGLPLILTQFRSLVEKEWLTRKRKWRLNLLLILCSCLCVFLVWCFEAAISIYQHMNSSQGLVKESTMIHLSSSLPNCERNIFMRKDTKCYSLIFSPDTEEFRGIIQAMCKDNQPPLDESLVKGFPSGQDMDKYLYENPNTVIATVEFFKESGSKYAFSVQTNGTVRWFKGKFQQPHTYAQLPVIVGIQKAIATKFAGSSVDWDINIGEFPHPSSEMAYDANFAPFFYISSMLLIVILQAYEIVEQREKGTIGLLTLSGMMDLSYWSYLVSTYSTLHLMNAVLLSLISLAFLFPTFMGIKFVYGFLLLANTSQAMMGMGLLLSSVLKKSSRTIAAGFACFFIAWTTMAIVSFGFPYTFNGHTAWKVIFGIFPWTVATRGYNILLEPDLMRAGMVSIYGILSVQTVAFVLLSLYLYACLPDAHGRVKCPWYVVDFWRIFQQDSTTKKLVKALEREEPTKIEDEALKDEEKKMRDLCQQYVDGKLHETEYAIHMHGIRKVYGHKSLIKSIFSSKQMIALEGNWFGVKKGECFCLLGPNSAGKTTTLKCLLGLTQPTEGQAIFEDMGERKLAQRNIGYCPQYDDALVDLLTFAEHLDLFCSMKGFIATTEEIDNLNTVTGKASKLVLHATQAERRQLSISIAMTGAPQIVVLDEPTAHIDPCAKRVIWKFIENLKQDGRSILMTTHSMNEAEILSDRIGIMVRGKLRCLGSALDLKNRFGSGYRLIVGLLKDQCIGSINVEKNIIDLLRKSMSVKTVISSSDYIEFVLPYEKEDRLPLMLTYLNNNKEVLHIQDVQVRPTPLEEVFMTITKKAELEHAQIEGRYETLILAEEGIALKIPVGADFIESPGGNFYVIKWTKDRFGQLKIYDYTPDSVTARLGHEKDR